MAINVGWMCEDSRKPASSGHAHGIYFISSANREGWELQIADAAKRWNVMGFKLFFIKKRDPFCFFSIKHYTYKRAISELILYKNDFQVSHVLPPSSPYKAPIDSLPLLSTYNQYSLFPGKQALVYTENFSQKKYEVTLTTNHRISQLYSHSRYCQEEGW